MTKHLLSCVMILSLSISLSAQQTPPAETPQAPQAQATPATPPPDTLLDATPVKLRLSDELSSARAHVGDVVHYEVMEDVLVSGVVVIRKGSTAIGTVTQAEHAKSRGRAGKLDLSISYVPLADQEKASLRGAKERAGKSNKKLMATGMAMTAFCIPCEGVWLLMKGTEITIPAGKMILVYVDGDMHLRMDSFAAAPNASASQPQ